MIYTKAGRALSQALEDPSQWILSRRQLKNRVTGQVYWIGSGPLGFNGYVGEGTPKHLGFIERLVLWRKVQRLRARIINNALRNGVSSSQVRAAVGMSKAEMAAKLKDAPKKAGSAAR